MNHSLLSADRNTHTKIVAVALIAAIGVVAVGITAHVAGTGIALSRIDANRSRIDANVPIIRAGKPAVFTRSEVPTIR
jgi:hypothetical protein